MDLSSSSSHFFDNNYQCQDDYSNGDQCNFFISGPATVTETMINHDNYYYNNENIPAHSTYDYTFNYCNQTYSIPPSSSCMTAPSFDSVYSPIVIPPLNKSESSTYTPHPQDPHVIDNPSSSSQLKPQKKRIQAVRCHVNSQCSNCGTRDTSLWRRTDSGEIECNACNLYERKNNRKRPITMKKGVILKRKRKPRVDNDDI